MAQPTASCPVTSGALESKIPENECFRASPIIAEIRGKKLAERLRKKEW
jgi:hypothetical protein